MAAIERHTFKHVALECDTCGTRTSPLLWDYDPLPACVCGAAQTRVVDRPNIAHSVIGDEIDRTLEHGLCYPDGTPRRFRSRQELARAERAAGYRILEPGEKFTGGQRHARRR